MRRSSASRRLWRAILAPTLAVDVWLWFVLWVRRAYPWVGPGRAATTCAPRSNTHRAKPSPRTVDPSPLSARLSSLPPHLSAMDRSATLVRDGDRVWRSAAFTGQFADLFTESA